MRTVDLPDHRIEIAPPSRRRRREEIGVFRKERDDRDGAHHIVRSSRRSVGGIAAWASTNIDCAKAGHRGSPTLWCLRSGPILFAAETRMSRSANSGYVVAGSYSNV